MKLTSYAPSNNIYLLRLCYCRNRTPPRKGGYMRTLCKFKCYVQEHCYVQERDTAGVREDVRERYEMYKNAATLLYMRTLCKYKRYVQEHCYVQERNTARVREDVLECYEMYKMYEEVRDRKVSKSVWFSMEPEAGR